VDYLTINTGLQRAKGLQTLEVAPHCPPASTSGTTAEMKNHSDKGNCYAGKKSTPSGFDMESAESMWKSASIPLVTTTFISVFDRWDG
jgi:hypothetical protein